jgi:hypothetical protein
MLNNDMVEDSPAPSIFARRMGIDGAYYIPVGAQRHYRLVGIGQGRDWRAYLPPSLPTNPQPYSHDSFASQNICSYAWSRRAERLISRGSTPRSRSAAMTAKASHSKFGIGAAKKSKKAVSLALRP